MNTSEHTPQHASHTPEERPTSTVQKRSYTAHRILRGAWAISARHYAGTGPAFVLMHGFPDNLHIYDRLIPYLRDRQVVTFDFLGLRNACLSSRPLIGPSASSLERVIPI